MGKLILATCLVCSSLLTNNAYSVDIDEETAMFYLERARTLYDLSEYDSLPIYYSMAEHEFNRLELYSRSAECKLGMVDYYLMTNKQSLALKSLESAEKFIKIHIGQDTESWVNAMIIRSKLYFGRYQLRNAISVLNTCLELEDKLQMKPEQKARIHYVLGAVYFTYGVLDSAELNYTEAYRTYMEITTQPTVEKGILLFNIGLLYSESNQQEKWVEFVLRGIENNIVLYGPNHPDLADYYNSLASYYLVSGKIDSANLYLDEAEQILIVAYGPEYFDLSRIYVNRARIYRYEGDYQASLDYYLQALSLNDKQEIPDVSLRNTININIGLLYKAIGDYQTSYQYFKRLLEAEGEVHPGKMSIYFSYVADILIYLGDYAEAEKYINKVLKLRQRYFKSDYYALAFDYRTYGILLDSTGQHKKAEKYFMKALSITRNNFGNYHRRTSAGFKTLGDHYNRLNDFEEALDNYQHSIHALVPEYNMLEMEKNPDPEMVTDLMFYLKILNQKARALESLVSSSNDTGSKKEYSIAAFSTFNTSVQVSEILRNSYLNDESKLYLSENERNTYEKGVRSAYQCYELSNDADYLVKAFQIAERGKYATLQSVLAREDALVLSGIPDSVLNLESGKQKQLVVFQEMLTEIQNDTLPDKVKIQQYESEIFRLKGEISLLHRSLELEFPQYYKLLYNKKVQSPDELAESLGKREKIIEYFIAGDELYIFEISRNNFFCWKNSLDSLFNHDINLVRSYISNQSINDTIKDAHLSFIESSYRLYKTLIPSANGFKNLIIIPEGKLSYFPFDILIKEPVLKFSGLHRDVPYLIKTHSIRYGYAATLFERSKRRVPGRLDRFLGFAPGYISNEDEVDYIAGAQREIRIDRNTLNPLPGSIDEVNEIGILLNGEAFTGLEASERKFKELAGEGHIIHLATHAFLDDTDPLKSTLVFSENKENEQDGFLNVYELYNMDLKARLVVLSACNTGAGEMRGGEGIISLARAFFYAGVPNIVMTLWTVDDKKSQELMLSFYNHLRKGKKAEVSLRKAKLDFLDGAGPKYQNPKFWAQYILVGNPEHLFFPHRYRQLLMLAGFFLVLISGWILMRKFRK